MGHPNVFHRLEIERVGHPARNIDFSKQGDREAIGNALIQHIRQTGGCDVNGKKQGGC
jgi:hypothetical protein